MKIAIIPSGFLPVLDGVTVSGFERLKKLSQWGHQVLFFCPDYSSLSHLYPNWKDFTGDILPGVKVINLPSTRFFVDFETNVSRAAYKIVRQELQIFQPELIHVDEPERLFIGFWQLSGIAFARKASIPCVGFYRTNFLEYLDDYLPLPVFWQEPIKFLFKEFLVWIYNSYDLTLIHNPIIQHKLQEMGIKNTVFDNLTGFDHSKFHSSLGKTDFFKGNYNLPDVDRQIKLIALGRLTRDKGWDFMLKAFAELGARIDWEKVALIIVGDGPMRDEIIGQLGKLKSNFYWLGRIPHDEVPALLVNSDIYITTSEKENRSLAILEALAAGLPIIAPNAGGLAQDIQDGKNGFLYTPQDTNDFIQKLKLLIENESWRQKLGNRGKDYVAEYTWDKTVGNLVKIWSEQIKKYS